MRHLQGLVLAVFGVVAGALLPAAPAKAQDCPGNPNALGTSRVLAVEPGGRFGVMQYPETLPLRDKEVVLTFDDGPLPPYSDQVLDILRAQCVRATFFLVGAMAHAYPTTARRIHAEGHTIGSHSEDHPVRFERLPIEKLRQEIDDGIAAISAALGDPKDVAPFFRVPGLARTDIMEKELAARSLAVFSSDTVADDWFHRIRASEIVRRAMSRLEARGKGILLLHDIHAVTVAALPELLKELKERGFRVVHVVPAPLAAQIEIASEPLPVTIASATPWADDRSDPIWPETAVTEAAEPTVLPAPDTSSFDVSYKPKATARVIRADGSNAAVLVAAALQWPDGSAIALPSLEVKLPAPRASDLAGWAEEKRSSEPQPRRAHTATHHQRERARAVARPNRHLRRHAIAAAQHVRPHSPATAVHHMLAPRQRAADEQMRGPSQKSVAPTRNVEKRIDRHALRMARSRPQVSCCS
jgi:peptidoglycan/xylan/chitin deacetylase (PgdA/CDA1 family)